jgi:hypothetical protein
MNPPVLSGSDPEDCTAGCVLTTKSVTIDQVPVNAELYYNGSLVTNGFTISNFNPALFNLRITAATMGDSTVKFMYSYVDAAMMKDPTPATYTLIWLVPLPADRLTAVANLNGSVATIKWSTFSEQNTKDFTVERSLDNNNWIATGSKVLAAGNTTNKTEYQMPDNIADLMQKSIIYYRVKLTDIDGKTTYSNVVVVRLSQKAQITAWPNPFQTSITINITTDKATTFNIKLMDLSGKTIRNMGQAAAKGVSQVTLRDVEKLPAGIYMLEVTDENSASRTVQKFIKN